jgi:hypothetical protein
VSSNYLALADEDDIKHISISSALANPYQLNDLNKHGLIALLLDCQDRFEARSNFQSCLSLLGSVVVRLVGPPELVWLGMVQHAFDDLGHYPQRLEQSRSRSTQVVRCPVTT